VSNLALPYYFARPAQPPPWPGIVLLSRGGGIDAWLASFCELLASNGYAALAPNMFYRAAPPTDLVSRFASLDIEVEIGGPHDYHVKQESRLALETMNDAAAILRDLGADRLAVVGFCTGGNFAYHAAKASPEFSAAVAFYGAQIDRYLGSPACPTLILFGSEDEYMSRDRIEKIVGHHPNTIVYDGIGHGFMHDYLPTYTETAYRDGLARLNLFLGEHLT
jgi:carboxymethylenebutenolidase